MFGFNRQRLEESWLFDRLFRFGQFVNLHTPWLNGVKDRFGLRILVERILRPAPKGDAAKAMAASLNDHIVTDRIQALRGKGMEEIDFYILLVQSLGDIVTCEPIPRYLKSIAPKARVHWIIRTPFRELIANDPFVDDILCVDALSDGKALCALKSSDPNVVVIDCHFDGTSCGKSQSVYRNPNNPQINVNTFYALGNLLGTFSLAAGLPRLDDAPEFHFASDVRLPVGLPERYAVLHCCSNESCRNWDVSKWLALAACLRERGIVPIEIGTLRMLSQDDKIVDLTGNRSLQQLALVIKNACVFIGIDSVFAHVANAVRTPTVALLGKYRDFDSYMPYSGVFAKSDKFCVVRAPFGKPARDITVQDALKAVIDVIGP